MTALQLAIFFVLAAVVVLVAAGAVAGQVLGVTRVPPRVMSGADVGFRVEGMRGARTPIGTVVVRVDGEWVEAEIGNVSGFRPGTH